MSRTDAHRPAWVQANDPLVRRKVRHDHRRGACDLGPSTRDEGVVLGSLHYHCFWDIDWNLVRTCSCWWCSPGIDKGPGRAYWRDQLRGAAKLKDWEDIDIPPFIDKGW
jgi:hypothetical protein